jgi:hypothetical protein
MVAIQLLNVVAAHFCKTQRLISARKRTVLISARERTAGRWPDGYRSLLCVETGVYLYCYA